MIVANIQLPKGIGDSQGFKGTQSKGDFLTTLTQAINTNAKESGKVKVGELVLEDEVSGEEGESIEDIVSQLGVFLNFSLYENKSTDEVKANMATPISEMQIVEGIEATNLELSQTTKIVPETQLMFFVSDEALESNENIASANREVPLTRTDLSSEVIEPDLMVEFKNMPDPKSTKSIEENFQLDKNLNMDNKNKPKDDFINEINGKVVKQVEEDELKPKNNSTRESRSTVFNTYIQENKSLKLNPEIKPEDQILPNDNIQNINETILKLVETTIEGQTSVMKVQLYPEEMGIVNVVLKLDKGKISTRILVDNDNIKQLFINKVNEISENLFKQNINMEKVEIELNPNTSLNSNSHFDSNENFNRNNREQFKSNGFIRFEGESLNKEATVDRYSNTGTISILA